MTDRAAERHLTTVAALDLAIALFSTAFALLVLAGAPEFGGLCLASLAVAAPHLVLWAALPRRFRWARALQLVLAALALPVIPVGIAWGAYVLRTLGTSRGRGLFDGEPRESRPFTAIVALAVAGTLVVVLGTATTFGLAGPAMARASRAPHGTTRWAERAARSLEAATR